MFTSRTIRAPKSRAAVSISALLVAGILTGGCESSGLSPREAQGDDYATFASLVSQPLPYTAELAASSQPARPLILPAKLAVAQVGEVAPPQKLIDLLSNGGKTWSLVSPVNGLVERYDGRRFSTGDAQAQGQEMRRYARELGADYLFVFGGTVDRSKDDTGLALADATIIGAFIMSVLTNGLRILSVAQEWQTVVTGVIIILAVYADILRRRSRSR